MPPRTSSRKKQAISYNEDHSADDTKPIARRVTGAFATKRKAESEEVEVKPKQEEKLALPAKVTKKRKVKGKEDDTMPLADRTPVSSLKKAMYIGAHVSGAGGMFITPGNYTLAILTLHSRRSKRRHQCRPYRRQRFRSLS